jgi:hypothetical protein
VQTTDFAVRIKNLPTDLDTETLRVKLTLHLEKILENENQFFKEL